MTSFQPAGRWSLKHIGGPFRGRAVPVLAPHASGFRGVVGGVAGALLRTMSRPGMMNTLGGGWARAKVGACEVHGKDGPLASPKTGGGLAGRTWAAASEPASGGRAFAGGPGGSVAANQRGIGSGHRRAAITIVSPNLRVAITIRKVARETRAQVPKHIDQRGRRYASTWWLRPGDDAQWERARRAQIWRGQR